MVATPFFNSHYNCVGKKCKQKLKKVLIKYGIKFLPD